jgi:hypothetical protein
LTVKLGGACHDKSGNPNQRLYGEQAAEAVDDQHHHCSIS